MGKESKIKGGTNGKFYVEIINRVHFPSAEVRESFVKNNSPFTFDEKTALLEGLTITSNPEPNVESISVMGEKE